MTPDPLLIRRIDAVLPQTQCRRCGYDGCRPYAEAVVRGEAQINRCPPGGDAVISALAGITRRPVLPLDPRLGGPNPPAVAVIDEARCIGCTLCIQACPVDAIVGAAKLMHTVIADECTCCELCIAPCPVDCIVMQPTPGAVHRPNHWRARYEFRRRRLQRREEEKSARLAARTPSSGAASARVSREAISSAVAAALVRARARRAAVPSAKSK